MRDIDIKALPAKRFALIEREYSNEPRRFKIAYAFKCRMEWSVRYLIRKIL